MKVRYFLIFGVTSIAAVFHIPFHAQAQEGYNNYIPSNSRIVDQRNFIVEDEDYTQIVYLLDEREIETIYIRKSDGALLREQPTENVDDEENNIVNAALDPTLEDILKYANVDEGGYDVLVQLKRIPIDDTLSRERRLMRESYSATPEMLVNVKAYEEVSNRIQNKRKKAYSSQVERMLKSIRVNPNKISAIPGNPQYLIARVNENELRNVFSSNIVESVSPLTPESNNLVSAENVSGTSAANFAWINGSGVRLGLIESLTDGVNFTGGCPREGGVLNSYDNLAGEDGDHGDWVGEIVDAVIPNSYVFCDSPQSASSHVPYESFMNLNPHAISASFSYNTHAQNGNAFPTMVATYPEVAKVWDGIVWWNDTLAVVSAGNQSPLSQEVSPMSRGPNTLAVGAINDNNTPANFTLSGDFMGFQKPEVSAVGTNINLPQANENVAGTSYSAPLVASTIAALIRFNANLSLQPSRQKALAVAGATNPVTNGARNGFGSLNADSYFFNPNPTPRNYSVGGARRVGWNAFDALDGNINGIYRIPLQISAASGSPVRVALSVMRNPADIWARRNTSFPMNANFDANVFDHNGVYIGGMYDIEDSTEVLEFNSNGSGVYRIEVERKSGPTTAEYELGVAATWGF